MFTKPQAAVSWLALLWCLVLSSGFPTSELETAESRHSQGWFKGIGFGQFSFGDDDIDDSDDKDSPEVIEEKDSAKSIMNTGDQNFKLYRAVQFGLSHQHGSSGSHHLHDVEVEGQRGSKKQEQASEGHKNQKPQNGKGQRENTRAEIQAQTMQGKMKSKNQNGENHNLAGKQDSRGEKNTNNGDQKANKEVADFYFGRRGQQQAALTEHSRTQNLAKQEYAVVEIKNEKQSEDSGVLMKKDNDEESDFQGYVYEINSKETNPTDQVFKDFYSGFRGQQQEGFTGHSSRGQQNEKFTAYSTVHQSSFVPSHQQQKDSEAKISR